MDDIEAFLLASATTGAPKARQKMAKTVEIAAAKGNWNLGRGERGFMIPALSVRAGRRSRSGSDVSFSGRGCVL